MAKLGRRGLLAAGLTTLAAGLLGEQLYELKKPHPIGLARWDQDSRTSSSLTVDDPADIRLLQFTDIHFGQRWWDRRLDQRTRDDMRRLIDRWQPHLLLITGDLWHNNPVHQGQAMLASSLETLGSLGLPWLFTWGNHDRLDDYRAGHAALTAARNSLYRGGPGGGCYAVHLQDRQGKPVWDLICLNSGELGLSRVQQQWLESSRDSLRKAAGAFAVFHIPLQQWELAWQRTRPDGFRWEDVESMAEDGSSLAYLKRWGGIRACLAGHDHVNDYGGEVDGIELIYGRATGYAGYGQDKLIKGGKLYTLNAVTGEYRWTSVAAAGAVWSPQRYAH